MHSLEELASRYLGARLRGFRGDHDAAVAGMTVMHPVAAKMAEELRLSEVDRLFQEVEMPLVKVLARIERRGMLIDVGHLRAMSEEFSRRLDALMKEIHALAGEEFNINSPPQLRAVLFDKLGLSKKGVRRGKTGYSTDVDVLNRLAKEHALPEKILAYRALSKLKSTYLDALPAAVNEVSGRLHTSLNQTVAATGRLSSSDPNLQNIPIRGEEGRRIREAFIAPPQHVLLAADYSQIELRVLAHLSQDPALLEAFRSGEDVHTRTAAEVFDVLPGLVSPDQRRAAKVINFGILYGMGPQRLAQELGIPIAQAQRYIGNYFDRYAGVRSFMDRVLEEGRERGYVKTILGRRRAVPELRSTERGVAQAAERVATNTPIQGSAADIIKLAMVAVDRRLAQLRLRAALLLQVHDELLLEVHEADRQATGEVLREEMEGALPLSIPLRVDIGFGRSWAEAH
jgi:DNA polymerase-1